MAPNVVVGSIHLVALSRFPIAGITWRWSTGPWMLTVICRATFLLQQDRAVPAAVQDEPVNGDRGYPANPSAGLYAPSDLLPMKPLVDVVVVGPQGPQTPSTGGASFARISVGELEKRVEVPKGNATGGLLPVYPALGPLTGTAPSKRGMGMFPKGSGADDWQGKILPADFDPSGFNVAPRDQRLRALLDDEPITLENLHPQHPQFRTRLPGLRPIAVLEAQGRPPERVPLRADTLWVEISRAICAVTWRAQLPLRDGGPLRVLVAVDESKPGKAKAATVALQAFADGAPAPLPFQSNHAPPPLESSPTSLSSAPPIAPIAPPPAASSAPPFPAPPPSSASALAPASPLPSPLPYVPSLPPTESTPGGWQPPYASPDSSPWARGIPTAPAASSAPLAPLAPLVSAVPAATPAPKPRSEDVFELVGFDSEGASEACRMPRFEAALRELEERAPHPNFVDSFEDDGTEETEERRDVFDILAHCSPSGEAELAAAIGSATQTDGRLLCPILLVAGEITLPFDELASLKATVAATTYLASADPSAMDAVATAKAFVASPSHQARPIAAALASRIRDIAEARGLAPKGQLDELVARALVGARAFQERTVFGAPHTRAYLRLAVGRGGAPDTGPAPSGPGPKRDSHGPSSTETEAIPVYLGEAIASKLPASERLRVRLLTRVHPSVDPTEAHGLALYPVAMVTVTRALPMRPLI